MRHLLTALRRPPRRRAILQLANYKPQNPQAAPSPPSLPKPPKKPVSFSLHGESWSDDYNWMSQLSDRVAMRHMDVYMEQEEKYTEAVMSNTDRLQSKLHAEMASRFAADLSTPSLRWGPWLYYRRVEEGMQYSVLCRRLASLNEEFISNKSPSAGFDFTSGKKIEQKLLDYNKEAERFGGYAYEELSEVSPDHRYLAYTMYDKDNDHFKLSVRDLNSGLLCNKPQADRVSSIAWAKNGQALLYAVTDDKKRPFRIYCIMLGSDAEDVMILEEPQENVHLTGQPVDNHYLLCSPVASSCIPRNWQNVFSHDQQMSIVDVDFCSTHLVLIVRNGRKYELYSLSLPLDRNKVGALLKDFNLQSLPLPDHVAQILPGSNYDFYSSTMRFTVSSPVVSSAVGRCTHAAIRGRTLEAARKRREPVQGVEEVSRQLNSVSAVFLFSCTAVSAAFLF
ncbi:hypothetical protein SASPL_139945 [Salvia splendens]|uniref:Peptidase S9A N-terminal domain-containing protein n=1 Tax=Salvia splendens TaxID=180675 RepID=A0A8X8WNW1_SALSN|nr:hypothetical protein SASPL_139945 [Salvia splendens]